MRWRRGARVEEGRDARVVEPLAGALGDVVQIVNRRSNTVFEGEVTGPSRAKVEITTIRELAQNR